MQRREKIEGRAMDRSSLEMKSSSVGTSKDKQDEPKTVTLSFSVFFSFFVVTAAKPKLMTPIICKLYQLWISCRIWNRFPIKLL